MESVGLDKRLDKGSNETEQDLSVSSTLTSSIISDILPYHPSANIYNYNLFPDQQATLALTNIICWF